MCSLSAALLFHGFAGGGFSVGLEWKINMNNLNPPLPVDCGRRALPVSLCSRLRCQLGLPRYRSMVRCPQLKHIAAGVYR